MLRKVARHLALGGRVLVSYYKRQEPPRSRLSWIARVVGTLTRSDWKLEAGDVLMPLADAGGLFDYTHSFEPGELEAEAARAGFRVAHVGRGRQDSTVVLTGEPPPSLGPEE